MRLLRKKQYDLLIRDAVNRGRLEMATEIRDFLKHADKVYLEPVTGYVGSVTNSLFLVADGGTALTVLPDPKCEKFHLQDITAREDPDFVMWPEDGDE